jgi:hypothetical protein
LRNTAHNALFAGLHLSSTGSQDRRLKRLRKEVKILEKIFINKERLTIPEAAALMGKPPHFLRIALQQRLFPFGVAVKMERWTYYINPAQFYAYLRGGMEGIEELKFESEVRRV